MYHVIKPRTDKFIIQETQKATKHSPSSSSNHAEPHAKLKDELVVGSFRDLYFGLQLLTGAFGQKKDKHPKETKSGKSNKVPPSEEREIGEKKSSKKVKAAALDESPTVNTEWEHNEDPNEVKSFNHQIEDEEERHSENSESTPDEDYDNIDRLKGTFNLDSYKADYEIEYQYTNSDSEVKAVKVHWVREKNWEDTEFIEDEEEKKQKEAPFKKVIQDFMFFPGASPDVQQMVKKQLYRLNREMLTAVNSMLSNNYTLAGKANLMFQITTPPTRNARMKFSRKGSVFTLELYSPISIVYEPDTGNQFALTFNQELVQLEFNDYNNYESRDICELGIKATLDLNNFPETRPEASIEISIATQTSALQYTGPQDSPYIINLETHHSKDLHPSKHPTTLKPYIQAIRHYLSDTANLNFGRIIGILGNIGRSINGVTEQNLPEIFQALDELFKQTLITRLLKHKANMLYRSPHHTNRSDEISASITLTELLTESIKNGYHFSTLLNEMDEELIDIFCHPAFSKDIPFLLLVFQDLLLDEIRNSSNYISQNRELFPELSFTNYLFLAALGSVRCALEGARAQMRIEMHGYNSKRSKSGSEPRLNIIHQQFLEYAARGGSNDSVFFELKNIPGVEQAVLSNVRMRAAPRKIVASPYTNRHPLPPPSNMLSVEHSGSQRVIHVRLPRKRTHLLFCAAGNTEKHAALWERNPIFGALIGGLAPHYAIRQFLQLFPNANAAADPYLIILDVVGGSIGFYTGHYAILNPKKLIPNGLRVIKVGSQALMVSVFSMGTAINAYLLIHPTVSDVTNFIFLTQIAPAPIAISIAYLTWNAIAPQTKARWFDKNFTSRFAKASLDTLSRTLVYGGVLEFLVLNIIKVPGNVTSLVSPTVPAFGLALLEYTRVKEKAAVLMTALTAADFIYMLAGDVIAAEYPAILTYIRAGLWTAASIYSIGFVARNALEFVRKYDGPPRLITQRISAPGSREDSIIGETTPLVSEDTLQNIRKWDELDETQQDRTILPLYKARTTSRNGSGRYGTLQDEDYDAPPPTPKKWCTIV